MIPAFQVPPEHLVVNLQPIIPLLHLQISQRLFIDLLLRVVVEELVPFLTVFVLRVFTLTLLLLVQHLVVLSFSYLK